MKYGYIRVSTIKQVKTGYSLEEQREAVLNAGADRIIEDAGKSGKNIERPGFDTLQIALRSGDTVIVNSLDRLGRSTADIAGLIRKWDADGITLIAINDGVDTSTAAGRFMAQILSSVAEMERALILERTAAGRAAAMEAGKQTHRPPKWTDKKALKALEYREEKQWPIQDIAIKFKVSEPTVYRMLNKARSIKNETDKQ